MIQEDHLGALENCLAVPERTALRGDGPAVHAEPQAIGTTRRLRRVVVQVPDFDAARVVPVDPPPVHGIFPIMLQRQGGTGFVPELSRAVFAITDTVSPQP